MDNENERIERDAAGVGPYDTTATNLVPMSSLDWKVSKGDVDVRGWEVRTVSGRRLGTVRELMVDPDAGEVVQLDVDVDGTGRHARVPIRIVQIDRTVRAIVMDSADLPFGATRGADPTTAHAETVIVRHAVVDTLPADDGADRAAERRSGERRRIDRTGTTI